MGLDIMNNNAALKTTNAGIVQLDGWASEPDSGDDDSHDDTSAEEGIKLDYIKSESCAKFFFTNAYSLEPKTQSMIDAFQSLNLHFACVTETWYRGGKELADHPVSGSSTRAGMGGQKSEEVGSACAKSQEILCVVGRMIGRKIVVFTVYIPPSMRASEFATLSESLAAEVASVKTEHRNPGIIVAGDFNHRDILAGLNEVEDCCPIRTGSTRGNSTIDIIYTNLPDLVVDSRLLPPLQAASGVLSDHNCMFAIAKFTEERKFKWVVRMRQTRTEAMERGTFLRRKR